MQLSGTRALLTGASGGLGRAIAAALAARGVELVISSRKPEQLERLAAELPGSGHRTVVCDLAAPGAGEAVAAEAGAIDLFVANAGLPGTGRIEQRSPEELARVIRVNLEAPILTTRTLLPGMLERGRGHFVYISSLAGKTPSPRSSIYNATKFGLRGFALGFRQDLRGTGLSASLVLPGFIRDAGMFADSGLESPAGMGTGTPEQVGDAVASAVEQDRAEVAVAPAQQRALVALAHAFPSIAARAQRGRGERIADRLADRQRDKR